MHYWIYFIFLFHFTSAFAMGHKVQLETAVNQAVQRYAPKVEPHLKSMFAEAHVAYPPEDIALLTFKKERRLQLWAKNTDKPWHLIHSYRLTAFSGKLGPKLKERDLQIPEGIYRLTSFNPFSTWHLSMMINYPNQFDKQQAYKEGRKNLGGDIFLHGKSASVGCLAVGDRAIEELFVLVRRVGLQHTEVIIAPNDIRNGKPATTLVAQPRWVPRLYQEIKMALRRFRHHEALAS